MTTPTNIVKAMPTEVNVAAFWLTPLVRIYKVAAARMARLTTNYVNLNVLIKAFDVRVAQFSLVLSRPSFFLYWQSEKKLGRLVRG